MRQTRTVEIGTGLFVFLGVSALFFLTTQTATIDYLGNGGYPVMARFDNVGDLKVGAPVSMAGVTIGRVEGIEFDDDELNAVVTMRIRGQHDRIPDDSDAAILTAGLLGGQYVGLSPGGSQTFLEEQSEIEFTQSAVVLESLISKYLFDQASEE